MDIRDRLRAVDVRVMGPPKAGELQMFRRDLVRSAAWRFGLPLAIVAVVLIVALF